MNRGVGWILFEESRRGGASTWKLHLAIFVSQQSASKSLGTSLGRVVTHLVDVLSVRISSTLTVLCLFFYVVLFNPVPVRFNRIHDKVLRDAGLLLISVVAEHGDTLCDALRKENKPLAAEMAVDENEFFPAVGDKTQMPALPCSSSVSNVVKLAEALSSRNSESALDEIELTRYLASMLVSCPFTLFFLFGWHGIADESIFSVYLAGWLGVRCFWRRRFRIKKSNYACGRKEDVFG